MAANSARVSHRSLFVSDVHLGSRFADTASFLDFLTWNDAETLFLVGDIFDLWCLGRRVRWSKAHTAVLRLLLAKVQAGSRIVLLPGNHDDNLRAYLGLTLGNIDVRHDFVHETATGKRYLVVHGDEHDTLVQRLDRLSRSACRWKERLVPLSLGREVSPERRRGAGRWSWMKNWAGSQKEIERRLAGEASARGLDGVVCGHTHLAADQHVSGVHYLNCGDWVGSSTAVSESWCGRLSVVRWHTPAWAHPHPAAGRASVFVPQIPREAVQ